MQDETAWPGASAEPDEQTVLQLIGVQPVGVELRIPLRTKEFRPGADDPDRATVYLGEWVVQSVVVLGVASCGACREDGVLDGPDGIICGQQGPAITSNGSVNVADGCLPAVGSCGRGVDAGY